MMHLFFFIFFFSNLFWAKSCSFTCVNRLLKSNHCFQWESSCKASKTEPTWHIGDWQIFFQEKGKFCKQHKVLFETLCRMPFTLTLVTMCSATVSTSASKDTFFGVSNRSIAMASQYGLTIFCSSSNFPTLMRNENERPNSSNCIWALL